MLPFGNQTFGYGFFGSGDWGRRVFWENVPAKQQELDAGNGDVLQDLLRTWANEYEAIMGQVSTLPMQRDPFQARAAADGGETMYVTQVAAEVDATYGTLVKLIEPADVGEFPHAVVACTQVGPTWVAEVGDGRWPVVLVRLRNADATYAPAQSLGNEVWCSKGTQLPFAYTAAVLGTGDATASPAVATALPVRFAANPGALVADAGVTVHFLSGLSGVVWAFDNGAGELRENVAGSATGNLRGTVDYDAGTITLDVDHDVPGDTVVLGASIYANYTVRGYYVRLRATSMLEWLSADFGLTLDTGAPADVQRAALVHYPHYMGQKGNAESYRVLGSIYLFDVAAVGLYEVCDLSQVADYPSDHVFQPAAGSPYFGRIFTDIASQRLLFDDIAADAEYYDHDGDHSGGVPGLVPLLDREVLYDDTSADTWSVAKAFAVDVTQGYYYPARAPATVVSATALTAAELVIYGLPAGFRVVVGMSAAQKAEFNYTGRGIWALTEYDKAGLVPPSWTVPPYWIDAEDAWDAGLLQWTVVVGACAAPTVGGDVAVRYSPATETTDCCYCRSNIVRLTVGTTAEGIAAYGALRSARAPDPTDPRSLPPAPVSLMRAAQCRTEMRLAQLLIPCHVRILEIVDV